MELYVKAQPPMEANKIDGNYEIVSTVKPYNTRWKMRARNILLQNYTSSQQQSEPKKRLNPVSTQSEMNMQGGNFLVEKKLKKSKIEPEAVQQPYQIS